jgi:hypothetical protein
MKNSDRPCGARQSQQSMSGIFDILPLILTGVSLLFGEGLNKNARAGESILKDCERLIKSLSPYQRKLLARQLLAADRRSRCLDTAITETRAKDY